MIHTVGIVSLSRLKVRFMPHARKGLDYVKAHPEKRAEDLLEAFRDPEIDMILCAIGGDDTYRLLPYLFGRDELRNAVSDKVFLGFSDTTVNHFMLKTVERDCTIHGSGVNVGISYALSQRFCHGALAT